jgi:hypothetical protein
VLIFLGHVTILRRVGFTVTVGVTLTVMIGAWSVVVKTRRTRRVVIPPGVVLRVMIVVPMILWDFVHGRLCVFAPVEVVVGFVFPVDVLINLGRWG